MKDCSLGLLFHCFLSSLSVTELPLYAGPHLEGHMLVCFATRCEDFLGQIFGKFRVPSRACQSAFHKRDCGLEGPQHSERIGRIQRDASRRMRVPLPRVLRRAKLREFDESAACDLLLFAWHAGNSVAHHFDADRAVDVSPNGLSS